VFDLSLKVRVSPPSDGNGESKGSGWQILHVYGSPNTNASQLSSDGTVMKVSQAHSCLQWPHAVLDSCLCMPVAAEFVCVMQRFVSAGAAEINGLLLCMRTEGLWWLSFISPNLYCPEGSGLSRTNFFFILTLATQIHTLFPSPKSEEGIKGGVVLLRMQRPSDPSTPLILDASYEDREGNKLRFAADMATIYQWPAEDAVVAGRLPCMQLGYGMAHALLSRPARSADQQPFLFPASNPALYPCPPRSSVRTVDVPVDVLEEGGAEFYQSSGVEKAVALARYTDILQSWCAGAGCTCGTGMPGCGMAFVMHHS
jgi:hypothetical protein